MIDKFFLKPGIVIARLPVRSRSQREARSQLEVLANNVLSLYVSKTGTRLWPSSYVKSLAEYLPNEERLSVIVQEAKRFACLPEAVALMDEIRDEFEAMLRGRRFFTVEQTAAVFCVTRSTVQNWRDKGALVPVTPEALPMVNSKRGRPHGSFFSQALLRQVGTWQFPRK